LKDYWREPIFFLCLEKDSALAVRHPVYAHLQRRAHPLAFPDDRIGGPLEAAACASGGREWSRARIHLPQDAGSRGIMGANPTSTHADGWA